MPVYQIDYDLNSDDYEELYDAIESLGESTHILESTWAVDCDHNSAADVRDELSPELGWRDEILVLRIDGSNWSWATNFSDESTEWLSDHLG